MQVGMSGGGRETCGTTPVCEEESKVAAALQPPAACPHLLCACGALPSKHIFRVQLRTPKSIAHLLMCLVRRCFQADCPAVHTGQKGEGRMSLIHDQ